MNPVEENSNADTSEPLDGAHEPCPTPLNWQEVLTSFEETADGQRIQIEGAAVDVHEFGDGPPLLFFPSLSGSPRLSVLLAWVLKDEYRCVLIDHPQWEKTPPPSKLLNESARTLGMVAELYAPDGADIYAPSFGGQIALKLMVVRPDLVRRCLIQGGWAHRRLTSSERLLLRIGSLSPFSMRRIPLWLSTQLQNHRQWFPPFDESRFGFLLNESGSIPSRLLSRRLQAAQCDLTPELESIRQPILLLRTEGEGPPIAAAMQHLEENLPNATSEWMPLTGHYPYLTHPHRLVKIIRNFFTHTPTDHE